MNVTILEKKLVNLLINKIEILLCIILNVYKKMIQNLILILTIISVVSAVQILYESKFLLDNENWQIIGNKKVEPAVHQSYSLGPEMSHYIMFKDNLINVEHKHPDDRSLWYFESPEITINPLQKSGTTASKNFKPKYPTVMTFTMTSFVGDFSSLNEDTNLVKIRNGDRCFTFKSPIYNGKTTTFNVPFSSQLWKKERTRENITDKEMKEIFIGTFTIEILGDWTRGYEVIGLDNVIIYA